MTDISEHTKRLLAAYRAEEGVPESVRHTALTATYARLARGDLPLPGADVPLPMPAPASILAANAGPAGGAVATGKLAIVAKIALAVVALALPVVWRAQAPIPTPEARREATAHGPEARVAAPVRVPEAPAVAANAAAVTELPSEEKEQAAGETALHEPLAYRELSKRHARHSRVRVATRDTMPPASEGVSATAPRVPGAVAETLEATHEAESPLPLMQHEPAVAPAPAVAQAAATAPAPAVPPRRPAPVSDTGLERELAILRRVQRSLQKGDARGALAAIEEHAQVFPHGQLAESREMSRVLATCALGERAQAKALSALFVARYPSSVFAQRAKHACAFP